MKQIWYYDLETLKDFFCGVFKCENDIRIFEISYRRNDIKELIEFLKTECSGLIGYNNINFDSQIIQYIWNNQYGSLTANKIAKFTTTVINSKWPIYNQNELIIPNLDIYKILHLDNKNRMVSLKWCQFMTDWPNVEDMPFNHNNSVTTDEQADLIIKYCINDVESTEHLTKLNLKEIDLRIKLSEKYNINFMNSSNSKIGSDLMLKLYCDKTEQDPKIVSKRRTERSYINCSDVIFPYIKFDSEPFQRVLDIFKRYIVQRTEESEETIKKKHITSTIHKNFKYDYGLGGIHGSLTNTIIKSEDSWLIIDADVALKWRN